MNIDKITGVVLAGGRGSRMGGVDKGLQLFREAPMVQHVLQRLRPQTARLLINANQNLPRYREFGVPVWPDQMEGFPGPLAGMQTALSHCETEFLVTAPCDSPFLPEDLVARLSSGLLERNADLAVAVTVEGESRQSHPVFCLARTSLLPHLTRFLENDGRKVAQWYSSLNVAEVDFKDETAFRNINTLDDLRKFENG